MRKLKKVFRFSLLGGALLFCGFLGRGKKSSDASHEMTVILDSPQPYPHQYYESKKNKVTVFGQIYRPRPDLAVVEILTDNGEPLDVTAIKIKTKDGQVTEGKVRRLPFDFMATARKNYQTPENSSEVHS